MNKETAVNLSYFLLRVVAGLLLLQAGGQKILGWFGGPPGGPPPEWSQIWVGGIIELVCGTCVLIGLFTRPAAFLLSGTMAVAYWQFHFKPEAFWPAQNMGVPAAILSFVFLFIAAFGGGPWSLDAAVWGRRLDSPESSA